MSDQLTINTAKPASTALDYEALRSHGLQYIQQLSSRIWTDYNVHDPGITTLELLCYAITDLAYRTSFPVEDLIATEKDTVQNIRNHFKQAHLILPNNALTVNDYRKLLIDIEGVKNAWLLKRTKTVFADLFEKKLMAASNGLPGVEAVEVKGCYDVLLEFETNIKLKKDKDAIIEKARNSLNANRNLCEVFVDIKQVEQQPFILCSEIELDAAADAFDTLAQIFFNVQQVICPIVKFHSLTQLLKENTPVNEIFEGPLLQHGFLKEEELIASELPQQLYLSDIMRAVMSVPGVKSIDGIIFNPSGTTEELPDKWRIAVMPGRQPVVSISDSNVLFYKNGIPFRPDRNEVLKRYDVLIKDALKKNESLGGNELEFNTGIFRNTGNYFSIQNHFPKAYGLSEFGLPETASDERKTLALQLKGYMYLFDQVLANYLSQLSNVRKLFSLHDSDDNGNETAIDKTYFTQLVDSFLNASSIYDKPAQIKNNIQFALENPDAEFKKRRNIFLDHLTARFAENFSEYVWMLHNLFPEFDEAEIIRTKIDFLKNYEQVSANRALSFNYADKEKIWNTDNVSGLEKRLGKLLGFHNINRRNLSNIHFDIYNEKDKNPDSIDEWRFRIIDDATGKILLSSSKHYLNIEDCKNEMHTAMQFGLNLSAYAWQPTNSGNKFYFNLIDESGEVIARRIEYFTTKEKMEAAINQIISIIQTKYSDEGMFLVEHLLLFPDGNAKFYLPICVDENCDDCADKDPYSFRISFVLPAYSPRFLNMNFRNYVERVIRTETPSHIFPKICWIDKEQMGEFELHYQQWLEVKAGEREDADGNILKEFIRILTSLKSIYPPAKIDDCSSETEKQLFILNQNSLGTLKS